MLISTQNGREPCKLLIFTKYERQGASSRLRSLQYIPYLKSENIDCQAQPLIESDMLLHKYETGRYETWKVILCYLRRTITLIRGGRFDLFFIEKELLPWLPVWFELWLLNGVPYIIDIDDAIFHTYDLHHSAWLRYLFRRRIDRLMAKATIVLAGNRYLLNRAKAAGATWVELTPTVVDITRYFPKETYLPTSSPRIVWIGSPTSIKYLKELADIFRALAQRRSFTLRVIGAGEFTMSGVNIETFSWHEDTESTLIADCDIGIMPLNDTPWEQGKCGYKLIQYMACGLPTVASAVGANNEVIKDKETGFLVSTQDQWLERLICLLEDSALRESMGRTGRQRVWEHYSLQCMAPRIVQLIKRIKKGEYVRN